MSDAGYSHNAILDISLKFEELTSSPEKVTLAVLLLHDVTGLKKKDIRQMLKYGPKLSEIYGKNQDFKVNKKPKAKLGAKTKSKKKKA